MAKNIIYALAHDRDSRLLFKIFICSSLLIFTGLVLFRFLGPHYEYIKAGDEYPGADVYRFDRFSGEFERCFVNKHRSNDLYKGFDKYENNETLFCYKSYLVGEDEAKKEIQKQVQKIKTEAEEKIKLYQQKENNMFGEQK